MGQKSWASDDQITWLGSMVDSFLEHQKAQTTYAFWIEMEKEWYIQWPSRGRLPTGDPDSKLNPIYKEKQATPRKSGKFLIAEEWTRLPQVTKLWSKRDNNYEEKVKHLVNAEVATQNIPRNKALAVVNQHTREVFNAQAEEVWAAMYAELEGLKNNKAKDAIKDVNEEQGQAPPDPKKYAAAIECLPDAILRFTQAIEAQTGFFVFLLPALEDEDAHSLTFDNHLHLLQSSTTSPLSTSEFIQPVPHMPDATKCPSTPPPQLTQTVLQLVLDTSLTTLPPSPLTTPNAASTTLPSTDDPLSNIDPALHSLTARPAPIPPTPMTSSALATAGTVPINDSTNTSVPTTSPPFAGPSVQPFFPEAPSAFSFSPITRPDGTQFIFPDELFLPASPAISSSSEHQLPSVSRSPSLGWNEILTSFNNKPKPSLPSPSKPPPPVKPQAVKKPCVPTAPAEGNANRGCGQRTRKAPIKELHTLTMDKNGIQTADAHGRPIVPVKRKSQQNEKLEQSKRR
ncbi:hypothetical protein C0991_010693, partial [Blastosporella zonata]